MRVYFLILSAFKATGGLEKFNRAFMKALNDISLEQNFELYVKSSHDAEPDEKYISKEKFKGYSGNKLNFAIYCLAQAKKMDIIFIGHINLAPVAILLKFFNPKVKLFIIGHGIEIWDKQILLKKILLKISNKILAVSAFTKRRITANNGINEDKIIVFPNTLDPYFNIPKTLGKPDYLIKRYGINEKTKVILTVTRINKNEAYKGYDKVLEALAEIISLLPDTKYILAGKYDVYEEQRLKEKVKRLGLEKYFILTGFIKEEELIDHYLLADVFILPSKKEGFGIVFIEAAACGTPAIAGNKDGSVDALLKGQIGKLVDPDNLNEIKEAIINIIANPLTNNRDLVIENFGFDKFKERLRARLIEN